MQTNTSIADFRTNADINVIIIEHRKITLVQSLDLSVMFFNCRVGPIKNEVLYNKYYYEFL